MYAMNMFMLVDAKFSGAMNEFKPRPPNVYGTLKPKNMVAIGAATTAAVIEGIASRGFASKFGN